MRYLNPKADLTFKKVFGEHKDIVISFLNALLPFDNEEEEIEEIEYLPAELVPTIPLKKLSIVDVRCKDKRGRQFIVEMQMIWTPEFKQRVLFNASKAYVSQLDGGERYELLQPVYSLNLVNEIYAPELENYYHHYQMVMIGNTEYKIEGLQLVFVELPKFSPKDFGEKRMKVLWMRYLTEINEKTREVPKELLESPEIQKAVSQLEESAFSDAQLRGYDKFWDMVSTERTYYSSAERRGMAKGMAKGMEEGMAKGIQEGLAKGMEQGMAKGMEQGMAKGMEQGMAKGIQEGFAKGIEQGMAKGIQEGRLKAILEIARNLKQSGMPAEFIRTSTGLTDDEISSL